MSKEQKQGKAEREECCELGVGRGHAVTFAIHF